MRPECVELGRFETLGRTNESLRVGQVLRKQFRDGERMHSIGKVSPHEAVAATAIRIHATTARHNDARWISVGIEEPLQKLFPTMKLVKLIE